MMKASSTSSRQVTTTVSSAQGISSNFLSSQSKTPCRLFKTLDHTYMCNRYCRRNKYHVYTCEKRKLASITNNRCYLTFDNNAMRQARVHEKNNRPDDDKHVQRKTTSQARIASDILRAITNRAFKNALDLSVEIGMTEGSYYNQHDRSNYFISGNNNDKQENNARTQRSSNSNTSDNNTTTSPKPRTLVTFTDKREYIVDSGASFHFTGRNLLIPKEEKTIRRMQQPTDITTANGEIEVTHEVRIKVESLNVYVWASIPPDSELFLLSEGKLVGNNKVDFIQLHGQDPYLQRRNGPEIFCRLSDNVLLVYAATESGNESKSIQESTDSSDSSEESDSDFDSSDSSGLSSLRSPDSSSEDDTISNKESGKEIEVSSDSEAFASADDLNDQIFNSQQKLRSPRPKQRSNTDHSTRKPAHTTTQHDSSRPEAQRPRRVKTTPSPEQLLCQQCEPSMPHALHYINHVPEHPNCDICNQCKIQNQQARRNVNEHDDNEGKPEFCRQRDMRPRRNSDADTNKHGDTVALIMQDRKSRWLQSYGCKTQSAEDSKMCFKQCYGPNIKSKLIYSDNSAEPNKATNDLEYPQDTCTPHRPQTNGIAERVVRRVKEGTSWQLVQSGFNTLWWREAMHCFCMLFNILDQQVDGLTPYESRFGKRCSGKTIPFGAEVQYKPTSKSDLERLSAFGGKTLPGLFLGYHLENMEVTTRKTCGLYCGIILKKQPH